MLSTKGQDWQPENNEDFGAMFAQGRGDPVFLIRLLIACCLGLAVIAAPATVRRSAEQAAPAPKIDKRKLLVQPRNADGTLRSRGIQRETRFSGSGTSSALLWRHVGVLRQMGRVPHWPRPGP